MSNIIDYCHGRNFIIVNIILVDIAINVPYIMPYLAINKFYIEFMSEIFEITNDYTHRQPFM